MMKQSLRQAISEESLRKTKTKDMKKTFTNHFLIKCLLAFMAILLVPSGAWGQSVKIAGTEITVNGDNVPIGTGSASLTLENDVYTLTLNGTKCMDCFRWKSESRW